MYKIGDEVVLLHITGSGLVTVEDSNETQIAYKYQDFYNRQYDTLIWISNEFVRPATNSDKEWVKQFYELLNKQT